MLSITVDVVSTHIDINLLTLHTRLEIEHKDNICLVNDSYHMEFGE